MFLTVISHKLCWESKDSASGYVTDGGFPLQMKALSELFDGIKIVVPCETAANVNGVSPLSGHNLQIIPLSDPKGEGLRRKLNMFGWTIKNGSTIWREVRRADAVHAPIPGDVGTIAMLFALFLRKPLFVRHCGNWLVQRTAAEYFWKWMMEFFAGGRNVMLATGGTEENPSARNPNVRWIFATSLRRDEIADNSPRQLPQNSQLKLIIACRQEKGKGTDIVIESLPLILKKFPQATLDVVGSGAQIAALKEQAKTLKLENRITFHGKVEHSQVIALLKQSHIFCYPTASEGFPKAVLEALACGLPVVTTNVSVLPKLIGSECGILLDQSNPANLAKAVIEVCSDDKKYERMSKNAIATAQQYTLEGWRDYIGEMMREAWKVSKLTAS